MATIVQHVNLHGIGMKNDELHVIFQPGAQVLVAEEHQGTRTRGRQVDMMWGVNILVLGVVVSWPLWSFDGSVVADSAVTSLGMRNRFCGVQRLRAQGLKAKGSRTSSPF